MSFKFHALGMKIVGLDSDGSVKEREKRFRCFYGTSADVVCNLWTLLVEMEQILVDHPNATCEHLLWTLYFLIFMLQ